jgi:hypothetical protein
MEYALGMVSDQDPPANAPVPPDRVVKYWLASPAPDGLWEHVKSFLGVIFVALAAAAVLYVLVKIVKKLICPVRVELCPVLDPGDQKLEKMGPLVAAGGD